MNSRKENETLYQNNGVELGDEALANVVGGCGDSNDCNQNGGWGNGNGGNNGCDSGNGWGNGGNGWGNGGCGNGGYDGYGRGRRDHDHNLLGNLVDVLLG